MIKLIIMMTITIIIIKLIIMMIIIIIMIINRYEKRTESEQISRFRNRDQSPLAYKESYHYSCCHRGSRNVHRYIGKVIGGYPGGAKSPHNAEICAISISQNSKKSSRMLR